MQHVVCLRHGASIDCGRFGVVGYYMGGICVDGSGRSPNPVTHSISRISSLHSMQKLRQAVSLFLGTDPKMRRLVAYWGVTLALYVVCMLIASYGVLVGIVNEQATIRLSAFMIGGAIALYVPVRASRRLGLSPRHLVFMQALFAVFCIVGAYSISGPVRGATLTILLVVLVFGAFVMTPRQSIHFSLLTMAILGGTMLWKMHELPQVYRQTEEVIHFMIAASMLVVVAFLSGQLNVLQQRLKTQKQDLADALERIQLLATHDELTALINRRRMNEILAYEEKSFQRRGQPFCLAMIDIDWFKKVNDKHGHAAGDEVLRVFAQQVRGSLRSTDIFARWGGEEFLMLLTDTQIHNAAILLQRIRERIATSELSVIAPDLKITFSAGLAEMRNGEAIVDTIDRADRALYQAKEGGRNCVVLSPETAEPT